MKKILSIALALTLVLSLGITSAFAAKSDSVVLRFAFSEAPESQTAKIMATVKENVEARTEGRVIIEPHWANELGSIADAIEQITLGGNIVSSTSASSWAPYGCDDMTAMDSMFAFSSTDEIAKFNESDMWKAMVAEMEEKGNIHMICMNWAAAPRVIIANKPINSVEDLKGFLVRVPTNTYAAWFSALGAAPVSGIPFAEVYTNIESGVIEGAEAPFATLSDYSVYEVAKYAFTSNHTYAAACFGTSTAIWNLLSPEDQAVVTEELTAGGKEFTAMCAASNEEYMKAFEDAGVTIVVPSEADKEAFAAAAAEAAVTLGLREGVMDEIKAASN